MKLQTLIVLGIALIALDAVQASYAASDLTFPPAAEQSAQPTANVTTTDLPRTSVRGNALAAAKDSPSTNWHEFGSVWHDDTLSSQTRAQVAAEAVKAEHSQTRSYFSY